MHHSNQIHFPQKLNAFPEIALNMILDLLLQQHSKSVKVVGTWVHDGLPKQHNRESCSEMMEMLSLLRHWKPTRQTIDFETAWQITCQPVRKRIV
jgi:hypothetical protein